MILRQFPYIYVGMMTFFFSIWHLSTSVEIENLEEVLLLGLGGLFLSLISATIHSYEETLKQKVAVVKYVG